MDRQLGPMNRRLGTEHPQVMPLQFQASNQAWHSITDGRGMLLITMIAHDCALLESVYKSSVRNELRTTYMMHQVCFQFLCGIVH